MKNRQLIITSKAYKLKYQYSDTSFIKNINCLQEYVGRNPYFKNKNCAKLSLITDKDGYPISICMNKGNDADINCLYNNLDNMIIDTETQKYNTKQNKYKQLFLADKGYDSTNLRGTLTNLGYVPIIPFNKRNTKDIKKIKKLSPKEKIIYRKRIKVENIFSNIKKNKKVDQLYEKSLVSYMPFLYISLIKVTSRFNNILNT